MAHNQLSNGLGSLALLRDEETRSISAENPKGSKGGGAKSIDGTAAHEARDLGQGWKVSPFVIITSKTTYTLADIEGPGEVRHFWLSGAVSFLGPMARYLILRIHWDDQKSPSVEVPAADFFACGWGEYSQINSIPVSVNPNRGYNCFWPMPFRKRCRITLENRLEDDVKVYYQITYALKTIQDGAAYLHAQFRRNNPLPYKEVHTIVEDIRGEGHYVGTAMAWGVNNNKWWGEGEIKFFDGDKEFPTICGTGTEDYFGGAYNWDVGGKYTTYSAPYMGMFQVIQPDGLYKSQQRFSMYRWHIVDPMCFKKDLRVTIQALGWRSDRRYLPRQDDISSVAYWYQTLPTAEFPELPSADYLEII